MKTRKTKKGNAVSTKAFPYKFHLDMCGIISESEGVDALETFSRLKAPDKITNKGVLTITRGENKKEISLTVPRLKRLFYPNFRAVILKGLLYGLWVFIHLLEKSWDYPLLLEPMRESVITVVNRFMFLEDSFIKHLMGNQLIRNVETKWTLKTSGELCMKNKKETGE